MSGRTIGVTLPIPAPYGSRLDVVRAQFGPDAHEMPAHVTVLPPIDVDDTAERIRRAREAANLAKESHQLVGPELVARWAA